MARKRSATARSPVDRARAAPALPSPAWTIAALGLLFLALLLVQLDGITRPFFADDYLFLEQVRGRGLAALASHDAIGNFVRPVSRAGWFGLLAPLSGESPAFFHVANLVVFAAALSLLFDLVRRRLGALAGIAAAAFVGLHYAADVPVRWASGSQDLLAIAFALLAIDLHVRGRTWPAAVALALALFSKEVVAGTVVLAIFAAHGSGTPWRATVRRALPLLGVTGAWAAVWLVAARSGVAARPELHVADLGAAFAHLFRVAAGLEFRLGKAPIGHWTVAALLPAALAALAAVLAAASSGARAPTTERDPRRPLLVLGVVWTLLGTLPLVPVMSIWSAYFYLWALAGVAVLVAVAVASLPRVAAIALVVVLVGLSAETRRLDEFTLDPNAWASQSHVDRHYLERSTTTIEHYLQDLRAARPTLPPRSTIFYANVPSSTGWQAADGPLLRWAYRDTSLRSYYFSEFTRARATRGPVFFFQGEKDGLTDRTGDPEMLISFGISMAYAGKERPALEALDMVVPNEKNARFVHAWRGWLRWSLGDTVGGAREITAAGMRASRVRPADAEARLRAAGADSMQRAIVLSAIRSQAGLDPWVYGQIVPELLAIHHQSEAVLSAFAFRVLAPEDPEAWKAWWSSLLASRSFEPALAALDRYLAMIAARGGRDEKAEQTRVTLERTLRGDIAAEALRHVDVSSAAAAAETGSGR